MEYELAKELSMAGYRLLPHHGNDFANVTLSELIGACVEIMEKHNGWDVDPNWHFQMGANMPQQGEISKIGKVGEWRASWEFWKDGDDYNPSEQRNYFGKTPEEAVAKLWLALNE